jgi:hypothetical protein
LTNQSTGSLKTINQNRESRKSATQIGKTWNSSIGFNLAQVKKSNNMFFVFVCLIWRKRCNDTQSLHHLIVAFLRIRLAYLAIFRRHLFELYEELKQNEPIHLESKPIFRVHWWHELREWLVGSGGAERRWRTTSRCFKNIVWKRNLGHWMYFTLIL